MYRRFFKLVAVVFLFILPANSQTEIRIGVVFNLAYSFLTSAIALVNITVNEMNANGTFPIPIRIYVRDGANSIRQTVLQADDLIRNQNVSALIGAWSSGTT